MEQRFSKIRIKPGFLLYGAVALMVMPLRWLISWVISAFVHELGHLLALKLTTKTKCNVSLDYCKAVIQTANLTEASSIICALAGPLAGSLLIGFHGIFPRVAICALIQTCYNLIPIYPLDCGLALQSVLRLLLPEPTAQNILKTIKILILLIFWWAAIGMTFRYRLGAAPILLLLWFMIQNKIIKIPCKPSAQALQ